LILHLYHYILPRVLSLVVRFASVLLTKNRKPDNMFAWLKTHIHDRQVHTSTTARCTHPRPPGASAASL